MMPAHAELLEIEGRLLAEGAPFQLEDGVVRGERLKLFKFRPPSIRAILERARTHGDAPFLTAERAESTLAWSYEEFYLRTARLAAKLASEYGIKKGDHIAILGANSPEWFLAFMAVQALGGVAQAWNAWWAGDELHWAASFAKPKLIIADDPRRERAGEALALPALRLESLIQMSAVGGDRLPDVAIDQEDDAIVLFTSGTSGRPKGVIHTHLNVCSALMLGFFHGARVAALHPPAPNSPPNTVLITSPFFHVSGLHAGILTVLAGGAHAVLPYGRFEAERIARLIERQKITSWGYTPTLLRRLVESEAIQGYDLSSLRVIGGGGAPVPEDLQERVRAVFPALRETFSIGYGLTEGTAFGTLNPAEEWLLDPASVGRALPTIEISIRDEDGEELPEGELGEVHIRSPLIMRAYLNDEAATREMIRPGLLLRTGDLGFLKGGRLYLASRRSDLILRGGENVYPAEIEARLDAHPSVAESAVVGIPDRDLGQRVKAIVVPSDPDSFELELLIAWAREGLAYYKVPERWEIRDAPLPRNATGKIVRPALLESKENPFIQE